MTAHLRREGHFSQTIEFTHACQEQARDMFFRMFSNVPASTQAGLHDSNLEPQIDSHTLGRLADEFAATIPGGILRVVSLQEYILKYTDPQCAVDSVAAWATMKENEVEAEKREVEERVKVAQLALQTMTEQAFNYGQSHGSGGFRGRVRGLGRNHGGRRGGYYE